MRPPAIEATIVPQPAPIALEDYTTDGREHTIVLDPAAQRAKILPPLPLPACKLLRQHTVEHIRFRSSSNDGPLIPRLTLAIYPWGRDFLSVSLPR